MFPPSNEHSWRLKWTRWGGRLNRKEGAQFLPPFCLPFFILLVRRLFSFLAVRALFFESPLSALPFFLYTTFFWLEIRVFRIFFRVFARALFPSSFFSFESALFFLFYMECSFFSPCFRPPFFFIPPSSLFNLGGASMNTLFDFIR